MRNLGNVKKWPVFLIAAAAACSGPPANDAAADNAAANSLAALEESHEAADNAAADGNAAAAPAEGNAVADVAATYRASGTEPFWSLTMTDAQMAYDSAEGPDVTVATPEPRSTRVGPVYETPEMTVAIDIVRPCQGGEDRDDPVRVTIGGQTVTGCGRGVTPR